MLKLITLAMFCLATIGCVATPVTPMPTQVFRDAAQPKKHLIVLLIGRGGSSDYFDLHDWPGIAAHYTDDYDFIAPYAHFGYYANRILVTRLREDVILPAKQQGYESISLAGISMGGLGCLLYSEAYPQDIDRIYLIAPFLGKEKVQRQIRTKGGLANWTLPLENSDEWSFTLWDHLKRIISHEQGADKLFLGYGNDDRLGGHDLLAASMPDRNVIHVPGGHRDGVFTAIWESMLKSGFMQK